MSNSISSGFLSEINSYVTLVYEQLLHRVPRQDECENWVSQLLNGMPEREFFRRVVECNEFKNSTKPGHTPGHFYSPIIDPNEVRRYWTKSAAKSAEDLHGIAINITKMTAFWKQNLEFIQSLKFSFENDGKSRYYYSDNRYPHGDALILGAMINAHRPSRIVEIGSGFSSAVMLDVADKIGLKPFEITCIDPYADRLRSLIKPTDTNVVSIIEEKVQNTSLEIFLNMQANDIVFIDSSHVLKTGSDVHYELFEILPRLASGIIVHFHDIQFPFEYPSEWIFDNKWSWNEIYAVQAFLMYNNRFEILFYNDLFFRHIMLDSCSISNNGENLNGGSLWLQVQ